MPRRVFMPGQGLGEVAQPIAEGEWALGAAKQQQVVKGEGEMRGLETPNQHRGWAQPGGNASLETKGKRKRK